MTNKSVRIANSPRVNHDGFESFYEAYYGIVLGYLKNKLNSFADAEDITGKVFLYCYEKWDTYDPEKASQATWLFIIVRSRCTDYLRRNRSYADINKLDDILAEEEDLAEQAVRLEAIRQELAVKLKELPENQRDAIIMRFFGDCSDDEIAERLHTTTGNVRVLIHRGINALKAGESFKELL